MFRHWAAMPRSVYLYILCFWALLCGFNLAAAVLVRGAVNKALVAAVSLGGAVLAALSVWQRRRTRVDAAPLTVSQFGRRYRELSLARYVALVGGSAASLVYLSVAAVAAHGLLLKAALAVVALVVAINILMTVAYRQRSAGVNRLPEGSVDGA